MTQASISPRDRAPEPAPPPAAPAAPAPRGAARRRAAPGSVRAEAGGRRAAVFPAGRSAAGRACARACLVAVGRTLCLDRQRLCRRRQGDDHALRHRPDRRRSTSSRARTVKVGDPLFDIDPAPYRTALALARGRLAAAKVEFANLQDASTRATWTRSRWARTPSSCVRPTTTASRRCCRRTSGTRVDEDTSAAALRAGQADPRIRPPASRRPPKVKLGGGPDTADRDLPRLHAGQGARSTTPSATSATPTSTAPIAGVATQVPQIELGRVAPAGQPVFAIVADTGPLGRRQSRRNPT